MKALVLAITVLIASAAASGASAAPMPVPFTWTGFYFGGQIGAGIARTSSSFSGFDAGDTAPAVSPNGAGLIVGGQVGYNRQIGFWLAGLETDIAGAFIKGNASSISPNTFFTVPTEQDINWFGTLRGRVGILPTERLLLFAAGGLAYGGVAVSSISLAVGGNCITSSCGTGSASATRTGPTVGGGFEYAWSNYATFKAEYLYVDLGTLSVTYPITLAVSKATTTSTFAANIVRVGLNIKLDAPGFGPRY
jgi:outer membrane immunogenic protein